MFAVNRKLTLPLIRPFCLAKCFSSFDQVLLTNADRKRQKFCRNVGIDNHLPKVEICTNVHNNKYCASRVKQNFSVPTVEQNLASVLVNKSSPKVQPYLKLMRFDKPIGSWLLFWPCSWSISLAADAGTIPDIKMLLLFGAGAFVMRGAGCTINDMWDRDIDGKVARTRERPLILGTVTLNDAWLFLAFQLSIALTILLQLNWYSVFLGASSLGLVIIYPLMKRITYWPQFILGMTFNWGALLGWSAIHSTCNWEVCLPLYISGVCWTIIYDTIYAHQDKSDDMQLGIKSTALKFGDKTKLWLSLFSCGMISSLITTGVLSQQTWPYYLSICLVSSNLIQQLATLNINDPQDCGSKFISHKNVGLIIFLGIVLGTLLKSKEDSDKNKELPSKLSS